MNLASVLDSFGKKECSAIATPEVGDALIVMVNTQAWMSATEPCWMKGGGNFQIASKSGKSFVGNYDARKVSGVDAMDTSSGAVCKSGFLVVDEKMST